MCTRDSVKKAGFLQGCIWTLPSPLEVAGDMLIKYLNYGLHTQWRPIGWLKMGENGNVGLLSGALLQVRITQGPPFFTFLCASIPHNQCRMPRPFGLGYSVL